VFEEEDFQPLVYGFKLASDVPEAKALALIKESEEDLMKEIKKCSPSSSSIEESQEMKVLSHSLSVSDYYCKFTISLM
jgi:indole-3-glycerol phosphate synthase